MVTALTWLLIAAALAFVGWPLFRAPAAAGADDEGLSPLERQKLEAYAAIKDAELDRQMGKLSEEDFTVATQRYRQEALAAITALEQARRSATPVPRQRRGPRRMAFCPSCGEKLAGAANFCSACGRSLRDTAA